MNGRAVGVCGGLLIGTCLLPLQAGAVIISPDSITLPNPQVFSLVSTVYSTGGTATSYSFNTGSVSVPTSGNGSATLDAELQPSPHMTANVSVLQSGANAVTSGSISYYFEIAGPTGISVPVTVTASASITKGLVGNVADLLLTDYQGYSLLYVSACNSQTAPNCTTYTPRASFSIQDTLQLTAGSPYHMNLRLYVAATTVLGSSSDVQSGYLDPVITIDPNFALANQFSLVFSPGVGNSPMTSAVPEPSAAVILAAGIAGMAIVRRRQNRTSDAPV